MGTLSVLDLKNKKNNQISRLFLTGKYQSDLIIVRRLLRLDLLPTKSEKASIQSRGLGAFGRLCAYRKNRGNFVFPRYFFRGKCIKQKIPRNSSGKIVSIKKNARKNRAESEKENAKRKERIYP